jgi:hypothetical protein
LFNPDEINRLDFNRLLELLQTFNPGWAEHNDEIPRKLQPPPAALRRELACSLPLITLCGMKKESEARRTECQTIDNPPHTVPGLSSSLKDN